MSNLENLTLKIVADSKEKAAGIIDEANAQAKQIKEEMTAAANREKDEILEAGRVEAVKTKDLILTKKRIEIRDRKLAAKQEMIQKVFAGAVEKLNQLSLPEYEAFLNTYLSQMALAGDEVLMVPERYKGLDMKALNTKLGSGGRSFSLTLGECQKEIEGGFILIKGGVENNNTFRALLEYFRDDLEKIVSDSLF